MGGAERLGRVRGKRHQQQPRGAAELAQCRRRARRSKAVEDALEQHVEPPQILSWDRRRFEVWEDVVRVQLLGLSLGGQ